jgi:DNA-binding NtrC family response regulator
MEHLDPDRRAAVQSTSPLDLSPVVLIADDERALLELLREALMADLFRVLTAADGQHALALAEASVPEVLVTDVAMPRLDGFGLVRALRRLYPGLPVIVMSGDPYYGERPVEDVAAEHGAFATLMKPFDVDDLRQAVQSVVSRPGAMGSGADRAA